MLEQLKLLVMPLAKVEQVVMELVLTKVVKETAAAEAAGSAVIPHQQQEIIQMPQVAAALVTLEMNY